MLNNSYHSNSKTDKSEVIDRAVVHGRWKGETKGNKIKIQFIPAGAVEIKVEKIG